MVTPALSSSSASRLTPALSVASSAARVAATVVAIPPAAYGWPLIRAANSADRSPANTRCAWLSTKPGITLAPPKSTRVVGGGCVARRPHPRDRGRRRRRRRRPRRCPVRCRRPGSGSLVTSSPMPVYRRVSMLHQLRDCRLQFGLATSMLTWRRSATTTLAVDHHVGDVGRPLRRRPRSPASRRRRRCGSNPGLRQRSPRAPRPRAVPRPSSRARADRPTVAACSSRRRADDAALLGGRGARRVRRPAPPRTGRSPRD